MENSHFDIVAIGNAIMDVLAYVDDAFLVTHALRKGTMCLVETEQANYLRSYIPSQREIPGGSAANTVVGFSALGGKTAFIGKVADDSLGRAFIRDINAYGVHFATRKLSNGLSTAYCLVLITPDAQRTMNTYLGACQTLHPDDIDFELVRNAQITYLEGYQWDIPHAKELMRKVAQVALESGSKVALSLSDFLCVDRHRTALRDWLRFHVDILFANEIEIISLYQVKTFEEALYFARRDCSLVALTRGAKGSVVATPDTVQVMASEPVAKVVDTTGAGDLFAAGFLYGLTRGGSTSLCARLGSLCAAEIINHCGVRPLRPFSDHVKAHLSELDSSKKTIE